MLPTASLAALLAVLLVVLQLRAADKRANESLDSYANLLAGVVLDGLRDAMLADDRPRLKKQLAQFAESEAVRRIDVVSTEGRVYFSSEPGFVGTEYSRASPDCNVCHGLETPPPNTARTVHYAEKAGSAPVYRIVLPIEARKDCLECHDELKEGQKLGILLLDLDESRLTAGQLRGARALSWALLGAFALLLGAVFVIVRVVVVARLRNVRRAVEIVRSGALVTATGGQAFDEIDEIERLVQCLAEDAEDRRSLDRATTAFNSLLDRCPEPVLLLDGASRVLGASPSFKRQQATLRGGALAGAPRPAPGDLLAPLREQAAQDGWVLGPGPEGPLVATVDDVRGRPLLYAGVWPQAEGASPVEGVAAPLPERADPEWKLYTAALVSGLSADPKRWKGVLQLDRRLTSGRRVLGDLAAAAGHATGERREVELRTMIQVVLWEVGRQAPAVTWHTILDERHAVLGSRYQLRTLVRRLAEAAAAQAGPGGHAVFFTQTRGGDAKVYLGAWAHSEAPTVPLDGAGHLPLCALVAENHGGGVEVDRGFDLGPLCEAKKVTLPCGTQGVLFVASLAPDGGRSAPAPEPEPGPRPPPPQAPGPSKGLKLVR